MKPCGTVWIARAKCFNNDGVRIGTCMDTPNAIAKAIMEHPEIGLVEECTGKIKLDAEYRTRMQPWNTATSYYESY